MSEIFDIEVASERTRGVLALHGPEEFLKEGAAKARENSQLDIKDKKLFAQNPSAPPGYGVWSLNRDYISQLHPRKKLEETAKIGHVIAGLIQVSEAQGIKQASSFRLSVFSHLPLGHEIEMKVDLPRNVSKDIAFKAAAEGVFWASQMFGASLALNHFAQGPGRVTDSSRFDSTGINFRIGSYARLKTDITNWDPTSRSYTLRGHHIQSPDQALACVAFGVSLSDPESILPYGDVA